VELQVRPTLPVAGGEYPPTARWDWDQVARVQYFGFKCTSGGGPAWCEVGLPEFHSSDVAWTPAEGTPTGGDPEIHRRTIKGWYDEQDLEVPVFGSPNDYIWSGLKGRVFPDPNLTAYDTTSA